MFYSTGMESRLRFGDVVQGFISVNSTINTPIRAIQKERININIDMAPLSIVISPCCSIEKENIALIPLIKLNNMWFSNPFFYQDFTRMNRPMDIENAIPPPVWESLPDEEKIRRRREHEGYANIEFFIYEKNDLFQPYQINLPKKFDHLPDKQFETQYYMIDFRNIHKINCESLVNPQAPEGCKVLQLSVETRAELRNKLAFYFHRIPQEDRIHED